MRFLFRIAVKDGSTRDQYVEAWKKGSTLIQTYPGARGTRLLQSTEDPNVLIAMAQWESKAARDSAMNALLNSDTETQRIWQAHREFGDMTIIGAFDETEWVVMPK